VTAPRKIAVVGASGVVGRAALEHFAAQEGWEVVGLSRRPPLYGPDVAHVAVDLLDAGSCRRALPALAGVTHVAFAALVELPELVSGWTSSEQSDANVAMLSNLLDALAVGASDSFRHLTLLQGTKAYGIHLGPMKLPAKESDPRHMPPNFYFEQEDMVAARAAREGWHWTVLRPQMIFGFALGTPMNILMALGTYAAISKELGLPLVFPGGEDCLQEATDARLLARAIHWAGKEPRAVGEIFNITNGDCFSWRNLWPTIAGVFGMEVGYPRPMALARLMADKGPVWDRIVERHGLLPLGYDQLVGNWGFADHSFRYGGPRRDSIMSTIKARRCGFADCLDSEEMCRELLADLQARQVLPGPV